MKVLFNPVCIVSPHFETELELIKNHIDAGDEIYVLMCHGNLGTCFLNYEHSLIKCLRCQSICRSGLSIFKEKVKIVKYPFSQQINYSEIPALFKNIDELKSFEVDSVPLGIGVTSSLVTRLNRDHKFDTVRYQKIVDIELKTSLYVYKIFNEILRKIKPDLVYLFNGRFSTVFPGLLACENLKINYNTHERGGMQDHYWIIPNTMPLDIKNATREMEEIWNKYSENERIVLGSKFYTARREKVEHCWFSYVKDQTKNRLPLGFDRTKKNIAIFNTTTEEFASIRCLPKQFTFYKDEFDLTTQICGSLESYSDYHIYLRMHPNMKGYENTQTRELFSLKNQFKNLTLIAPEEDIDSYSLLDNSTKIVTFASTMGAEACYWGKPSVLLGRALYENMNCTYNPKNHDETKDLLLNDIEPKSQLGAIKYGLWELHRGILFKHFRPNGLFAGKFMNHKIQAGIIYRILSKIEYSLSKGK